MDKIEVPPPERVAGKHLNDEKRRLRRMEAMAQAIENLRRRIGNAVLRANRGIEKLH